jgi:hypothetical protein
MMVHIGKTRCLAKHDAKSDTDHSSSIQLINGQRPKSMMVLAAQENYDILKLVKEL